ncbi:MarR family winged helix-turn-helix transcriptional regulator [Nonomuraea roseola]|uniref:MarR family winged helix-turn-helix transcriptional regulator n=1 Tax=Nonomuraea roseola TaxID=46179 RepID=A0ABV5Q6K8_9ACTN
MEQSSEPLGERLGYLLKHAYLRFAEESAAALEPYGIDGRELAVLAVLSAAYPLSQLEAAGRLGVDRTSMVAILDTLEAKGLVARRRSSEDRRKNIVELTDEGRDRLEKAERARDELERRFLAPLGEEGARSLTRALRALATAPEDAAPEA